VTSRPEPCGSERYRRSESQCPGGSLKQFSQDPLRQVRTRALLDYVAARSDRVPASAMMSQYRTPAAS
jgi:hypothetical protein